MRATAGKLESDLEFHKKNQLLAAKQVDTYEKELKKANNIASSVNSRLEILQSKFDDATNQLLDQKQDVVRLKLVFYLTLHIIFGS